MFTPAPFIKAGVNHIDYINHVLDSTFPMNLMANINAGDLLVFLELNRDNDPGTPAAAYPTGWTAIGTQLMAINNYARICASYKVAIGNEDSTQITGMSEDQFWNGIVLQYRANKPLVSLSASTPVQTSSGVDPAQQTIAAASGIAPVIGFCNYYTYNDSIYTRSMSLTADHEIQAGGSVWYLKDLIQNTNPQNYTFDMPDSGSDNALFGFYLHTFR